VTATLVQSRQLVRTQPYAAQRTFGDYVLANSSTLSTFFDLAIVVTDTNQLLNTDQLGQPTVGPYLDVSVLMTTAGVLDIQIAIDLGAGGWTSMLAAPLAVVANVPLFVSGLRIPARGVSTVLANNSGSSATVQFGAFVRSN
jgi:hypothetical protein